MNTEDTNLEANESADENFTETEETTQAPELEDEQDVERITLTKAELDERERAIRKEQDKRWKDRLKGQKDAEEGDGVVATKEEMDRFRLESKGIEDKSTQDFVLKYAKLEEISVTEALKDEVVQAKLSKMNADADRLRATGSPFNRTSRPREKTPEELARLAETGKIASTKEDRKKALAALQSKYGRT